MNSLKIDLKNITDYTMYGGRDKAIEKHKSRGKLLARERINAVVDEGYVCFIYYVSNLDLKRNSNYIII